METLNHAKGMTLNFNLRQPHSKRPTNLYAIVKLHGKQIKIPTTAKICAYLWNSKKQLPVLSEDMSDANISNALAVSSIIFSFRRAFADFYLYLCNRKDAVTTYEVKHYFTEKVLSKFIIKDNMAKNGVPNVKHEKKASNALLKALDLYQSVNVKPVTNGTLQTYKYNLQNFIDYCNEVKRDSILMLTDKGLNDYEIFLREKGKTANNIRNCLRIIRILVNNVIAKHPVFKTYGIKKVDIKLPQNIKTEGKKVELTIDEIKAIETCEGLTPKQEEYRDLFVLECLTGQRASDIPILFDPQRYSINNNYFSFTTKKEGVPALVERTPEILAIIERYNDGFKHINVESEILAKNETIALKLIAEKANLNRKVTYSDSKGIMQTEPLHKIISSHYGRHTFVTYMARKVPLETLKFLTGHKDTQALQKYYLHQTEDDRVDLVNKALKGTNNKKPDATFKLEDNELNNLFAYDSLISIIQLSKSNTDIFHLESTQQAIGVVKDVSKLNNYPKDIDISKVTELEQVIFELSYYYHDSLLYSVFKHKEHYFGMDVEVPSTEEVEAMFVLEDNERPKRWQEIQLEEWENRNK